MFRLVDSLEHKAFQNYRHACLPCLQFGGNCTHLRLREVGKSTIFIANSIDIPVFKGQQDFHLFRRLNILSRFGVALLNPVIHKTIPSFRIFDGVWPNSSYNRASANQFSSKAPSGKNKNVHVGARGKKRSANANSGAPVSTSSPSYKSQVSNEKVKQRQDFGRKKNKVKVSGGTAHSDAVQAKGSGGVSPSKRPNANSRAPVSTSSPSYKNQISNKKVNQRQHLGSKKNKEKVSGGTAHSDTVQAKGSGGVSPSKRPNANSGAPVSTLSPSYRSQNFNKKVNQRQHLGSKKNREKVSGGTAHSDTAQAKGSGGASPSKRPNANLGAPVSTSSPSFKSQIFNKNVNQRQHLGSKKNRKKFSGGTAHSDTVQGKGSGGVSPSKRSNNVNNSEPSQTSKNNLAGSTRQEVSNSSNLAKQPSKKSTRNSSRKGKSLKGEGDAKKPDGSAVKFSGNNESPWKQKSQIEGKTKHPAQQILKQLYPPTEKSVVVVESVAKAKVIQGYLGDMYDVLPSYGHIRDLAARSGSVRPDDDFGMVWEVPPAAWTHLKIIKVALSGAKNLILASDPDNEGEAIAWHISEMLQQQGALHEDNTVARVVFHEITESAIKTALQVPRSIDINLVNSYLARRALDYLIGFNISPLLWRKLPGCASAGRVQSAALSLICDREMEIDNFKPQEYWSVGVEFKKDDEANSFPLQSFLTRFGSREFIQFSISSHAKAKNMENKINSLRFMVVDSKRNKVRKNPPPPYITSTLQQDAANQLDFTAAYTMKLAQKLYEGVELSNGKATGLITYMRTDGLHVSNEAAMEICSLVVERYGQDFASKSAQKYFNKVKNAQEAREAIRPTDIRCLPSMLTGILDEDSLKLYTLIWSRTMACQMEPASIDQIHLDIGTADQSVTFRSTCSRVNFLGYQAVYKDVEAEPFSYNEDEVNISEPFEVLCSWKAGDLLYLDKVELKQYHTQPPPRYSEALLVEKLEKLGVGRPSTYASTLKVLQARNYVTVKTRVLHPEFRGRMVSAFLSHHFSELTSSSLTADMETELDNVSAGLTEWRCLLKDYWTRFSLYFDRANSVHTHQVEKMLEKTFRQFLFSSFPNESRTCPSCMDGTLIFKVGKIGEGYFIGCDQHPRCRYVAWRLYGGDNDDDDSIQKNRNVEEPKLLGLHPGSNEKVLLKNGPFGFYVQLGEDRNGYSSKKVSIYQRKDVDSVTLEDALELLRYPLTLGKHPDDNSLVVLRRTYNGFSVFHRNRIAPIPKNMKPHDINLDKALKLLVGKDVRKFGGRISKPRLKEVKSV